MNDLRRTVADFLRKTLNAGARIAVGVSGGRDSMCLLHAVAYCGAAAHDKITAVHVNHGLRDEADDDMAFVEEFCKVRGIDFFAHCVDVKKAAADSGVGIEQAARQLRYDVFYSLLNSGYDCVLTAHHALDNAESVLMHLFRGAGLDGLRGMRGGNGKILRPLISVYPDELDEYAKSNGIKYVVDKTNLIDDADRNFLRLHVIPMIEERYRGAVRAVNAFARECESVCGALDGMLDDSLIVESGGAVIVSNRALCGELRNRYVRKAIGHFTLTDVTRAQIERVAALSDMRVGAEAELSNGVNAVREYDGVALYVPRYKYDGCVDIKTGANFLDGLRINVTPVSGGTAAVKSVRGGIADYSALDGAQLRFRRDGDVFTPFGGGAKKLKEYMITKKIPSRLRDRIPLVCKGGEVLVVVGYEISDKVKISGDTTNAVLITR